MSTTFLTFRQKAARGFYLALLTGVFVLCVAAQADEIDKFVLAEMESQRIPGVAVAVIKDGKVVKEKGYGVASIELNVPVSADSAFKIGSISKPMIAIGVMRLVEEGKMALNDPVKKYFTDAPASWDGITIRHLLSHTSGIVREAPGFNPMKVQPDYDVIKTAFPLPVRFAPGEKYEYCNVGYFSLAEIITRVSGKPWPIYLDDTFFRPLQMSATRVTSNTDLIANRVSAYGLVDGKYVNAESYRALRPSGAFFSTLKDLIKWNAALESGRVLKKDTMEQMWTATKLTSGQDAPYGLGWQIGMHRGKRRVGHGGSLTGFKSDFVMFPQEKVTVIVLSNQNSAIPANISTGVAAFYIKFPEAAKTAKP